MDLTTIGTASPEPSGSCLSEAKDVEELDDESTKSLPSSVPGRAAGDFGRWLALLPDTLVADILEFADHADNTSRLRGVCRRFMRCCDSRQRAQRVHSRLTDPRDWEAVADTARARPRLTELHFGTTNVRTEHLEALSQSAGSRLASRLRVLSIRRCFNIRPVSLVAASRFSGLQRLHVDALTFEPSADGQSSFPSMPSLRQLALINCNVRPGSNLRMLDLLRACPRVRHVFLGGIHGESPSRFFQLPSSLAELAVLETPAPTTGTGGSSGSADERSAMPRLVQDRLSRIQAPSSSTTGAGADSGAVEAWVRSTLGRSSAPALAPALSASGLPPVRRLAGPSSDGAADWEYPQERPVTLEVDSGGRSYEAATRVTLAGSCLWLLQTTFAIHDEVPSVAGGAVVGEMVVPVDGDDTAGDGQPGTDSTDDHVANDAGDDDADDASPRPSTTASLPAEARVSLLRALGGGGLGQRTAAAAAAAVAATPIGSTAPPAAAAATGYGVDSERDLYSRRFAERLTELLRAAAGLPVHVAPGSGSSTSRADRVEPITVVHDESSKVDMLTQLESRARRAVTAAVVADEGRSRSARASSDSDMEDSDTAGNLARRPPHPDAVHARARAARHEVREVLSGLAFATTTRRAANSRTELHDAVHYEDMSGVMLELLLGSKVAQGDLRRNYPVSIACEAGSAPSLSVLLGLRTEAIDHVTRLVGAHVEAILAPPAETAEMDVAAAAAEAWGPPSAASDAVVRSRERLQSRWREVQAAIGEAAVSGIDDTMGTRPSDPGWSAGVGALCSLMRLAGEESPESALARARRTARWSLWLRNLRNENAAHIAAVRGQAPCTAAVLIGEHHSHHYDEVAVADVGAEGGAGATTMAVDSAAEAARTDVADAETGAVTGVSVACDSKLTVRRREAALGTNNWTAVHAACAWDDPRVLALLLAVGHPLEDLTRHQQSPLHVAAWSRRPRVCEFLLRCGADPSARDDGNSQPWQAAESRDAARELVERLRHAAAEWRQAWGDGSAGATEAGDEVARASPRRRRRGGRPATD